LSGYLSGAKGAQAALDAAAVEMSKLLGSCAPLKYPVQ
jgi:multiple sugar transport system substrate-binding protein